MAIMQITRGKSRHCVPLVGYSEHIWDTIAVRFKEHLLTLWPLNWDTEWFNVNGCYRLRVVCVLYSRSCWIAQTCLELMISCPRLFSVEFKAGIPNSILWGAWGGSLEIKPCPSMLGKHFTTEVQPQPLQWYICTGLGESKNDASSSS